MSGADEKYEAQSEHTTKSSDREAHETTAKKETGQCETRMMYAVLDSQFLFRDLFAEQIPLSYFFIWMSLLSPVYEI